MSPTLFTLTAGGMAPNNFFTYIMLHNKVHITYSLFNAPQVFNTPQVKYINCSAFTFFKPSLAADTWIYCTLKDLYIMCQRQTTLIVALWMNFQALNLTSPNMYHHKDQRIINKFYWRNSACNFSFSSTKQQWNQIYRRNFSIINDMCSFLHPMCHTL